MNKIDPIRIVVADDHPLYRRGVVNTINEVDYITIVGEAADGKELVPVVQSTMPDVVLIDVSMPRMNGIAATKIISARYPKIGIIAVSGFGDSSIGVLFEMGARGFIVKPARPEELIQAIVAVHQGKEYRCELTRKNNPRKELLRVKITSRELDVMLLICQEKTTIQMADILNLSPRTVEYYKEQIFAKTGASNFAGIVKFAIKNGLYEP